MSMAFALQKDDQDAVEAAASASGDRRAGATKETVAGDDEDSDGSVNEFAHLTVPLPKSATARAASGVSVPPEPPRERSQFKLTKRMSINDCPSEVFCVKYSPDGKLLAAGCGDGAIRVYNADNGKLVYNLNVESMNQLPTTSIRFRPSSGRSKTKNVLLAVNADGSVDHWHITSGRRLHTVTEKDNQLFCVDYRADGSAFAAAGKDYKVRIYDEATKTRTAVLSAGFGARSHGHSNRVFSLKFKPSDPNIVVSGGWDNTVQIWDLRVESSVRSFYGPHIAGDAVDVCGDTILTGSWRPDDALQTWDYGTGKLIETVRWEDEKTISSGACQLYCAQYSRFGTQPGRFIAAGGSGSNEARVFDVSAGNAVVGVVTGLTRAVFTGDFAPNTNAVAFAGGDSAIHTFSIDRRSGDVGALGAREYRESCVLSV